MGSVDRPAQFRKELPFRSFARSPTSAAATLKCSCVGLTTRGGIGGRVRLVLAMLPCSRHGSTPLALLVALGASGADERALTGGPQEGAELADGQIRGLETGVHIVLLARPTDEEADRTTDRRRVERPQPGHRSAHGFGQNLETNRPRWATRASSCAPPRDGENGSAGDSKEANHAPNPIVPPNGREQGHSQRAPSHALARPRYFRGSVKGALGPRQRDGSRRKRLCPDLRTCRRAPARALPASSGRSSREWTRARFVAA